MFNNNKPNREFQSGLKTEERRRSRQDDRLRLRRVDRENRLQKKRQTLADRNANSAATNSQNQHQSNNAGNTPQKQQEMMRKQQMLSQLPNFVKGCYSDHPATQFECTQRIRKLLSIPNEPPILAVIDSGVVTRLVQFLQFTKFDRLQFEAAWALTNIASGTAENTAVVIRYGAVPIFVKLLDSESMEVREQAIWALGNIAGDSPECRNLVLQHGGLSSLLPLLRSSTSLYCEITLLRNATWTLSNFCRGKPSPDWKYVQLAIKALSIMITSDDTEILQDCAWAFSYLSDVNDSHQLSSSQVMKAIIASGSLDRLISLLEHEASNVRHPSLRTIGNIVTGCDQQTQRVLNLGVLKKLHHLLLGNGIHSDRGCGAIKREACWTISNITAGSAEQIEAVICNNLIPVLIQILSRERFEISKEALWAISNATSGGTDVQVQFLVNQGVIQPLCRFFNPALMKSHKCLLVALEGIDNILAVGVRGGTQIASNYCRFVEEAGGVDYLEEIQAMQSIPDEIYDKAAQIVKSYFGAQDMPLPNNNMNVGSNNNGQSQSNNHNGQNNMFNFGIVNNNNHNNGQNNDNNNGGNGAPPQFNF